MKDINIVLIAEFVILAFSAFMYMCLKAQDRANLWRKLSCKAGAIAIGIEVTEQKYLEYKTEMGIQEVA